LGREEQAHQYLRPSGRQEIRHGRAPCEIRYRHHQSCSPESHDRTWRSSYATERQWRVRTPGTWNITATRLR